MGLLYLICCRPLVHIASVAWWPWLRQIETLVAVIAYKSATETASLNKHQALKLVEEVMKY